MYSNTIVRLNLTGPRRSGAENQARYRDALAVAQYAESCGISAIALEEHHCTDGEWLQSPIPFATAILAKTERINVYVSALLVPLYDRNRLAADLALLDLLFTGRFSFVAGLGYREIEYEAMGKNWRTRGESMNAAIERLLGSRSGEEFDLCGKRTRVCPATPFGPPMSIGGTSKRAASRAAKYQLPLSLPQDIPDVVAHFKDECSRTGAPGSVYFPPAEFSMVFIDENPDQAWCELGEHFLHEAQEYSSWADDSMPRPGTTRVDSVRGLREQGFYEILTPLECLHRLENPVPDWSLCLHPMAGGIPTARSWDCMKLFATRIGPYLSR